MTTNGQSGAPGSSDFDQIYRAVAGLEVAFERVARNQDSLKSEIKTIAPRLDALGSRIDTLAAELGQLGERVHAANNLVTRALDDAARIHQEHNVLDRAIDKFEAELKLRTGTLVQAQSTLESMIDVLETRVQRLRDSVIPDAPDSTAVRARDLPDDGE